jgi:hypothetical protein
VSRDGPHCAGSHHDSVRERSKDAHERTILDTVTGDVATTGPAPVSESDHSV